MYWSRTGSYIDLIEWLFLISLSWIGGWMLCVHAFNLRSRERLFGGVASGSLLFILFSNLFAQVLSLSNAYWAASLLILGLGLIAVWCSHEHPKLPLQDLKVWPQIIAFGVLFLLFALINRGLAIFDDYSNLPIVSVIATGDVPPHFYLNPEKVLDYHYGLHLIAASLVRVGGFFPWSALDLCKAFSISLAALLNLLWYRRYMRKSMAWLWGGLFVLFGGGSRWLLLLIPSTYLQKMGAGLQMIGSGLVTAPDLYTALISPWRIEGDGPIPFPFAFVSGMSKPLSLALGSNSAFPLVTLALLLLLAQRRWHPWTGLCFGLLIASLALTSDHIFTMVWAGILLTALLKWWCDRSFRNLLQWGYVLLPGLILAPIMGGVLTEAVQRLFKQAMGVHTLPGVGLPGIAFRWPPAFVSGHLGTLVLTDFNQILIALAEMGPILLLAPIVAYATMGYIRSGKLYMASLSITALVCFIVPLFIRFTERERDITRLTSTALLFWMVLGFPYVWMAFQKGRNRTRFAIGAGYVIAVLGGIALLPTQLISIARTQPSYFVHEPDAILSRLYWDRFDQGAWVLDPAFPYRPPTLFGRTTGPAYQDAYIRLPEFRELLDKFDPLQIALSGYSYIYIDKETWQRITPEQRQAFQHPCIKIVDEQKTEMGDFRRLFDIRKCQTTQSETETP